MSYPLEIDNQTVQTRLIAGDDFLLLDCREQQEFDIAHLKEATLLPMSELQERVGELEEHKEKEIIVYCHHGGRSLQVTQWLRNSGFDFVSSMAGGIDQWSLEIDPSLPRY